MSHACTRGPAIRSRSMSGFRLATVVAVILAPFSQSVLAADGVTNGAEVTGTHIRGSADSAFPIVVYIRDIIERSGASTLQEFIQKLPQNFNGGASETTLTTITG